VVDNAQEDPIWENRNITGHVPVPWEISTVCLYFLLKIGSRTICTVSGGRVTAWWFRGSRFSGGKISLSTLHILTELV